MGIFFAFIAVIFIRFAAGGNESAWSCINNQWVKLSNSQSPQPNKGCGNTQDNWQQEIFNEANISLKIPIGMVFQFRVIKRSCHISGYNYG